MPLVPAKCTSCGATLTVDNSKDATICEICGAPFIVEKAIENFNTTNGSTDKTASVPILSFNIIDGTSQATLTLNQESITFQSPKETVVFPIETIISAKRYVAKLILETRERQRPLEWAMGTVSNAKEMVQAINDLLPDGDPSEAKRRSAKRSMETAIKIILIMILEILLLGCGIYFNWGAIITTVLFVAIIFVILRIQISVDMTTCLKCGKKFAMQEVSRKTINSYATTIDVEQKIKNTRGEVTGTYTQTVPATRYIYACVDECKFCTHRREVTREATYRD